MVISVSPKIIEKALNDDKSLCRLLRYIFSLVDLGKHELIVEGNYSLKEVIESPQFSNFRELLKFVEEMSIERHSDDIIVEIIECAVHQFSSSDYPKEFFKGLKFVVEKENKRYEYIDVSIVKNYLGEKLRIYLENGKNDGLFLKGMYQLVKGEALDDENLVDLRNAGGIDNLPNELERIKVPMRVICIVDSDKKFPEHQIPQIKNINKICNQKDFHLCVLKKRMIENYIPENLVLKWLKDNNLDIDHPYFQMTKEQKECFHLKKGLRKKDLKIPQVKKLYNHYFGEEELSNIKDEAEVIKRIGNGVASAFDEICVACCTDDLSEDVIDEITDIIYIIDRFC